MKKKGFTLLEILLSLTLLGAILITLFRFLGATTQASNSANASSDLIREGQISQQVIAARLKEACYIYTINSTVTMGSTGVTTINEFGAPPTGYDWIINTHPIVAMILPPNDRDQSDGVTTGRFFRFYAYYPIRRSRYIGFSGSLSEQPNGDALNDNTVWMLVEYRKNLTFQEGDTTKCADMRSSDLSGRAARLLVDYVSPASPISSLFVVGPESIPNQGASYVDYNLQFERAIRDGGTVRVGQDAASSNLRGRIYPQNLGL